jgi:hypothetical protein
MIMNAFYDHLVVQQNTTDLSVPAKAVAKAVAKTKQMGQSPASARG